MKIKQRISKLSIKKKIIFYSYIVITPILLIISGLLFAWNYSKMRASQNELGMNSVRNLENSLEELNQNMVEMSTYICINSEIIEILTSDDVETLNQDSQLWLDHAPMRFIQDTLALRGYMKTLGIYPENGVQPYLRCMDSSSYIPKLGTVKNTELYQDVGESRGKIYWQLVPKNANSVYQANRSDKIVLFREMYDLSKRNPLAYLVIGADAQKYRDLCEASIGYESDSVMVLNQQGEELVSYGDIDDKTNQFLTGTQFRDEYVQPDKNAFTYQNNDIYWVQNEKSGMIICMLINRSNITDQLLSVAYTPLALLLGFLLGLFPVLNFVSNIVTKPLGKVCQAMLKFRQGDFSQQVGVETGDEVGEVAECFNKMAVDTKHLIDENYVMELRKKESELMALQAQINPHFLYNTLDSLYWQAQEEGNEEIAENILALSNLFRLVLGQGKGTIAVAQEIDLVREYLKIQKMRFARRFDYDIEVDPDIEHEMIPKLIIQPFVENAVVHGFENTDTQCSVFVRGRRIEGGMEFTIRDTGIGMTDEQVHNILEIDDNENYKGQRIGRYAIKNVKERLTIRYQERFDLIVKSELNKGTEITIRIFNDNTDAQGDE